MTHMSDPLGISTHQDGATAVIELDGEFDLHGMAAFSATVTDLLAHPPTAIEIDAASLTFIDSSGLRALLIGQNDASAAGTGFGITKSSEPVGRILAMTGLDEQLTAGAPSRS